MEEFFIKTADECNISVGYFSPKNAENSPINILLINPATGVKKKFYTDFAHFFTQDDDNWGVYVYDYRGVGASAPPVLAGYKATMLDWIKDYEAVLNEIIQTHPTAKIHVIGHSWGGHIIGFASASKHIHKAVMVASQNGFWRNWTVAYQPRMFFLWHILIPSLTHLYGYFPSKLVGMGENLPKNVGLEWAKFGRNKGFWWNFITENQKNNIINFDKNLLALGFDDDEYAPEKGVKIMLETYKNAQKTHWQISPKEIGVKSIGHFNFFRKNFETQLWGKLKEWIKG